MSRFGFLDPVIRIYHGKDIPIVQRIGFLNKLLYIFSVLISLNIAAPPFVDFSVA